MTPYNPLRDKSLLYPPFAARLTDLESRLAAARLPFYLFMGLRTWEQQDALYQQGRSLPGKRVTNARGGESLHNYGFGADYVLDGMLEKPGIQWSWDLKADLNADGRNDWLQLAETAEACGLESGFRWKAFPDAPHVQNTFGLTLTEMKELHRTGGLPAVWEAARL